MRPVYRAKTMPIKLDNFKHFAETIQQYHAQIRHDNLFNTHLTCSEGLLKMSSISGLTGPKTATPLPDRWCNDLCDPVLPIPEEVCTSVHRCSRIEFCTLSSAEYSKHNSTGFRSGEFGGHNSGVCWTINYRALFKHHIVELFQQYV